MRLQIFVNMDDHIFDVLAVTVIPMYPLGFDKLENLDTVQNCI